MEAEEFAKMLLALLAECQTRTLVNTRMKSVAAVLMDRLITEIRLAHAAEFGTDAPPEDLSPEAAAAKICTGLSAMLRRRDADIAVLQGRPA